MTAIQAGAAISFALLISAIYWLAEHPIASATIFVGILAVMGGAR